MYKQLLALAKSLGCPQRGELRHAQVHPATPRRVNCAIVQNPTVSKGCNCVKSRCIKAYCECYAAGRACAGICCCMDCANEHGVRPKQAAVQVPDADFCSLAAPAACLSQGASVAAVQPLAVAPLAPNRRVASTSTVPRLSRPSSRATSESDGESAAVVPAGLRHAPHAAATMPQEKRHNLDDLIAAAEVVEASEVPPGALQQLLSPGWALPRPGAASMHVHCDAPAPQSQPALCAPAPPMPLPAPWPAGRSDLPQSAPKRLRRATHSEADAAAPQTVFLLPAGTPVDSAMHYTVAPCDVDPCAEYSGATVQLQHGAGNCGIPRLHISDATAPSGRAELAAAARADESVRDACARLAASPPRVRAPQGTTAALIQPDADAKACTLDRGRELGYLVAPEAHGGGARQGHTYRPVPVGLSAEAGRPPRPGSVLLLPQSAGGMLLHNVRTLGCQASAPASRRHVVHAGSLHNAHAAMRLKAVAVVSDSEGTPMKYAKFRGDDVDTEPLQEQVCNLSGCC